MRRRMQSLIYRKWFYGFLVLALWIDSWTDFAEAMNDHRALAVVSLVLSLAGAVLVTMVFLDLHLRWPTTRTGEPYDNRSRGGR